MKTQKILFSIVLILIAIPLITALFVPSHYHVQTTIVINQPKDSVYQYLTHLKNQNDFGPWSALDPQMKNHYHGTDGTVGFIARWESNHPQVGVGEQEIIALKPGNRIDTQLRFESPNTAEATAYFTTEAKDTTQTKVVWGCEGSLPYPINILLLTGLEDKMRDQFDQGLQNLKHQLEQQ